MNFEMQAASIIMVLVACMANLYPANSLEKEVSGKTKRSEIDTPRNWALKSVWVALNENKNYDLGFRNAAIQKILKEKKAANFSLGKSKKRRSILAWYFPGTSEKNALVIGGVHGSELSAIEVAETLVQNLLTGEKIYYNVIIVPCLFPDNAATAKE